MLLDNFVGFIAWLLDAYFWIVIVAVIVSWVNPDPRNPLVKLLRQVTEPVFEPVRRWLPPWKTGGLDFSPMIVLVAIQFLERVILPSLFRLLY
ncbi:MAG TPA: YggT family protein [Methylomirabilota bacterium]|nr:YggT family protein [Methylomirabilota bacterium]